MRRRIVPLLLLLSACDSVEPNRVGVVVSTYPSEAGRIAATDHLNAGGPRIDVVVMPSQQPTAAGIALGLAEQLAADPGVLAVVGHPNSAASLAASQVYNRVGLVQIAPTTTATVYEDAGPYSFRMVPGDDHQAEFVADAVTRSWPDAKRIAAVYVNDDYGRSFYRELRPRLGTPVFEGVYAEMADTTHLLGLVEQIAKAQPDVLIWIGRPLRLRIVLQPLRSALPDLRVICGDACDDASVHENRNGKFSGLRFVRFVDPLSEDPAMQRLQQQYRAATGEAATSEALLTYDAVRLIGHALASGAGTRAQVREFLLSLGRDREAWQGVTGRVAFDAEGNVQRSYLLAEIPANGGPPSAVRLN